MSILSRVVGLVSRNGEGGGATRHFAVMSPTNECAGERKILLSLFENGLSTYHLRRPYWQAARIKAWIDALPVELRSRIVQHQFPHLVRKLGTSGYHLASGALPSATAGTLGDISAQCEDFQSMLKVGKYCRRLMLGPIFPPEKYDITIPRRTLGEYAAMLAYWRKLGGNAEVLAFGGVNASNISICRKAGFDGVVVVGAVWNASDPVKAFKNLIKKW